MAIHTQKSRSQHAAEGLLRAPARANAASLSRQIENTQRQPASLKVLFFHHGANLGWTAMLAESLRAARFVSCDIQLSLTDINSWTRTSLEGARRASTKQVLAIVVSGPLHRHGDNFLASITRSLKELEASGIQVVAILKDNVAIPSALRVGEWFDFRIEKQFKESASELAAFLSQTLSPSVRSYSLGVSPAKERILCNLFPVVELPRFVYSYETPFQSDAELTEVYAEVGPLPALLKNSRVYTTECPAPNSPLAFAASSWDISKQEDLTQWFSDPERSVWGIELLNKLFRRHAWKRGLRWDMLTNQYFFPRNKPKTICWEIGGQTVAREVTAPHIGWVNLEDQAKAEIQYGWKHQSVRADFLNLHGTVYFRLEPGWTITKLDSKTPASIDPVTPLVSNAQQPKRNGQTLCSWRFWSSILSKGHNEIRINTGQMPIRARLTPLSGFTQFGIASDRMSYDQLMRAAVEVDLLIPALGTPKQVTS